MRNAGGRLITPPPLPQSTYLEKLKKQLSLQASQGPLMREGCGAINVADERKIKAATSRRLSLVWDSRPRRADGSDNEDEHREPSVCVVRWHASFFTIKFSERRPRKNEAVKRPTMLAGSPTVPKPWREKYVVCLWKHAEEEVGGGENKAHSTNRKPQVRLSNVGQPIGFDLVREPSMGIG